MCDGVPYGLRHVRNFCHLNIRRNFSFKYLQGLIYFFAKGNNVISGLHLQRNQQTVGPVVFNIGVGLWIFSYHPGYIFNSNNVAKRIGINNLVFNVFFCIVSGGHVYRSYEFPVVQFSSIINSAFQLRCCQHTQWLYAIISQLVIVGIDGNLFLN